MTRRTPTFPDFSTLLWVTLQKQLFLHFFFKLKRVRHNEPQTDIKYCEKVLTAQFFKLKIRGKQELSKTCKNERKNSYLHISYHCISVVQTFTLWLNRSFLREYKSSCNSKRSQTYYNTFSFEHGTIFDPQHSSHKNEKDVGGGKRVRTENMWHRVLWLLEAWRASELKKNT